MALKSIRRSKWQNCQKKKKKRSGGHIMTSPYVITRIIHITLQTFKVAASNMLCAQSVTLQAFNGSSAVAQCTS